MAKLWKRIRQIWISVGVSGTVVFAVWSALAYRPSPEALAATVSHDDVSVEERAGIWQFANKRSANPRAAALIFFPGAAVDPRAYAPLLRAVAAAGFPGFLIELPRRGMFGGGDDPQVDRRLVTVLSQQPPGARVALAGHSLGVVVASRVASRPMPQLGGLVLIGSSHPRDVDLSGLTIPVTKIAGTRDGIATRDQIEQNAAKLPASTRWVWVEGGNHSQFGWYGFQPLDWPATIEAPVQRQIMIDEVLRTLRAISDASSPD